MPTRRYRRKRISRKRKSRKTTRRTRRSSRFRPAMYKGVGFAPAQFVKLRYSTTYSFAVAAGGGIAKTQFTTDLTAPSGSPGAPRGFNEWSNFYGVYEVFGVKAKLRFLNSNTVNPYPMQASALWSAFSNPITNTMRDFSEARNTLGTRFLSVNSTNVSTLSSYMSVRKLHGYKDIADDDAFRALTSTGPANLMFLNVCMGTAYGAPAFITTGVCFVELTYYVKFIEPKDIVPS